jgi:hypothetical protein
VATKDETAANVDLDDEAKQLKLLQIKAEARQAIAEADAATVKATLPDLDTKALTSVVDLGEKGGASLATVVAATTLSRVAEKIAALVAAKAAAGRILVVEERSVAESDAVFALVDGRLRLFADAFTEAEEALKAMPVPDRSETREPIGPKPAVVEGLGSLVTGLGALAAAPNLAVMGGLGALASGVVSLLRTDLTVGSRDVSVSRLALIAEIVRQLPTTITTLLPGFGLLEQSEVFKRFNGLLEQRQALERLIVQADYRDLQRRTRRIDWLGTHLADQRALYAKALASDEADTAARILDYIAETERTLAGLEADRDYQTLRAHVATTRTLVAAFDAFVTTVTTVPAGGKYAPLVAAALREQLRGPADRPTHLLYVELSAAGGEAVSRSGFLGWGQRAAFLGAVQATFLLAAADGTIEASGAVTRHGAAQYDFKKLHFEP